jgi:sugar phosphate isomerase/epimerase
MRLSVSSYSFEALPLDGALAVCKSMGFKVVDIAGFHQRGRASLEPDEVAANPQRFADNLRALLDKHELEAADYFPQFATGFGERSVNDPDPAVRRRNVEAMRGIVRFCKLVGIHTITVLPGATHAGRSLDENLDTAADTLRQYAEIAGEQGVQICFEAHMGSVVATPELALDLLARALGTKFTLDFSHYLLQYIPMERIYPMIPHTGNFHIRQARPGKLQTRFIEGTLDFVDLARRLEAAGYDGFMSLEYVAQDWYDGFYIDTISETVATMAALTPHIPL